VQFEDKRQNPIPSSSLPMPHQFARLEADGFLFVLFFINHSSYADQKRACLSFPFSCHYHHNSNSCVAMGTQASQAPHYLLFLIIIISRHKPAFLRQKVPHTIPRLPKPRIPSVWIPTRIPRLAWNILPSTLLPSWTWQLLPSTRRRRTRSCRRRRCRTRHTRTATPSTNLRRRAERRPLSTLGPTDHARRPRAETRAARSPASGNVGGAFVAAGVAAATECAGGCESRGGGEAYPAAGGA